MIRKTISENQPENTIADNPESKLLRALDSAPTTVLTNTTQIRSEARLAQIMATDPNPAPVPYRKRLTKPQLIMRLAAIPALAAAFIAGSVLAPSGTSIAPVPAFATWTSSPTPLTGERLLAATERCLDFVNWHIASSSGDHDYFTTEPVFAEQRGDFAFLIFAEWNDPVSKKGDCLILFRDEIPLVVTGLVDVTGTEHDFAGSGGSDPELWVSSATWSFGALARGTELPPNSVFLSEARFGTIRDEGSFNLIVGQVADDVVGLTVVRADGELTVATVENGLFVAWWPDERPDFGSAATGWNFGPGAWVRSGIIELEDGTILENQQLLTSMDFYNPR